MASGEPLISIFDNFCTFNKSIELLRKNTNGQFKSANFKLIEKLNEADDLLFYVTLRNYFNNKLNIIKNRLLIIIYINDAYFEKFLNFLINKHFYFHLIIITSGQNLANTLRKHFKNFESLDYLKITNSETETNCLEIKRYDKSKYKDILHFINLS